MTLKHLFHAQPCFHSDDITTLYLKTVRRWLLSHQRRWRKSGHTRVIQALLADLSDPDELPRDPYEKPTIKTISHLHQLETLIESFLEASSAKQIP